VTYTVRASPEDAGQSMSIALSGPVTLPDGQQLGSVTLDTQGVATFGVVGAAAGPSTVTVTLPYRLEAGTVFSHIDDSKKTQRLVVAEKQDLVARATAQANWSAPPPTATPPPTPVSAPQPTATPQPLPPRPTVAPQPPEQPTAQAPEQPTPPAEQPTAAPPEQPQPTAQSQGPTAPTAAQSPLPPGGPAGQPAGGAAPVRPQALPNTGSPGQAEIWPTLGIAALLVAGGWLVRRRAARR
jgi:LPXTG-motif cell wall-anchored protein